MLNKKEPCKVCETPTRVRFNINFKKTPVCERCADSITQQQVMDLTCNNRKNYDR